MQTITIGACGPFYRDWLIIVIAINRAGEGQPSNTVMAVL